MIVKTGEVVHIIALELIKRIRYWVYTLGNTYWIPFRYTNLAKEYSIVHLSTLQEVG
jgi:hypothetical protein